MAEPHSSSPPARIGPSGLRRAWLALTAWLGDHPLAALAGAVLVAGGLYFYGVRLHGFAHAAEAFGRWRMEVFGGTFKVQRSIEVPDVILSFRGENYDRLDAMTASAAFMGGSAFRAELKNIADRPGARLRIVALDPRMGNAGHLSYADFAAVAAAFGMEPLEYRARCWHSVTVLLRLVKAHAPALEVRLLDRRLPGATAPFFSNGRSLHLYRSSDSATRLDVLVPHPQEADGADSFAHPGLIVRNRPDDAEVSRFTAGFQSAWDVALPLDAALEAQLLPTLSPAHEPTPPGNQ